MTPPEALLSALVRLVVLDGVESAQFRNAIHRM